MQNQDVRDLLIKYRAGSCTEHEKALLESWYLQQNNHATNDLTNEQFVEDLTLIGQGLLLKTKPRVYTWLRITAAASVFICLSIAVTLYFFQSRPLVEIVGNDIMPGNKKAILTLANGRRIVVNNAKNGVLTRQGIVNIVKTSNGQIHYQDSSLSKGTASRIYYNTLTTPKGGEFRLVLSDGTAVWLNAASSITYPVTFSGKYRAVTTTGEVYFEVAHNPSKPFRVITNAQTVEVLGTHFNVSAYPDDPSIKTTLKEGSVKVSTTNEVKIIKPGQQAIYTGNHLFIDSADVEEALAWKNGYFRFHDEKIGEVMKRLGKWYDIDVVYTNINNKEGYTGAISRYKTTGQVLQMLAQTGAVKFKVEGRRVTVL